jgi:hypothetical protein
MQVLLLEQFCCASIVLHAVGLKAAEHLQREGSAVQLAFMSCRQSFLAIVV